MVFDFIQSRPRKRQGVAIFARYFAHSGNAVIASITL
jgi:hypothetical protein